MLETTRVHTVLTPQVIKRSIEESIYIPENFKRPVMLHILANILEAEVQNPQKPELILSIAGPVGVGKSFMTQAVCAEIGIPILYISGSALSSKLEGQPREKLLNAYTAGLNDYNGRCVILIDDIDTSIMSQTARTTVTVNSQIVSGSLMNLCDQPSPDGSGRRVPIICTGNNLQNLYRPLLRAGRMRILDWVPGDQERSHIIRAIFKGFPLNDEDIQVLVSMRNGNNGSSRPLPISFFNQVKNTIRDEMIWSAVGNCDGGLEDMLDACLDKVDDWKPEQCGGEVIIRTAQKLLSSQEPVNHFAESKGGDHNDG